MNCRRRGDGCQRPPRQRRRDSHQHRNDQQTMTTTCYEYTIAEVVP